MENLDYDITNKDNFDLSFKHWIMCNEKKLIGMKYDDIFIKFVSEQIPLYVKKEVEKYKKDSSYAIKILENRNNKIKELKKEKRFFEYKYNRISNSFKCIIENLNDE